MSKLQEALTLLEEAEDRVRQAREIVQRAAPALDGNDWAGGYILAEVLKAGGSVKRDRLHELAAKYGMDNRGLGGFFTGKGSLHYVQGTDLVMLTPEGAKPAVRYMSKLGTEGGNGSSLDDQSAAWTADPDVSEQD